MTVAELFIELGFHADTMKLKEFMRAVGELNMTSVAATLGLGTLYEATNKIMNVADQAAMSLFGFSQTTGLSTKQTQGFSSMVETLGGTSQDAQSSLKGLQNAMLQVQLGRGNAEPFILMGISPKTKDIFEVMAKVQQFLKESSAPDSVKQMLVAEMGLSTALIPVLKNSKDIRDVMKEFIVISPEEEAALVRSHAAWAKLSAEWKVLVTDIGARLAPMFEKIAQGLDWIVTIVHKYPFVIQIVIALAAAVTAVTLAIGAMNIALAATAILGWISGLSEIALVIGLIAAGLALIALNIEKIPKIPGWLGKLGGEVGARLVPGLIPHMVGAAAHSTVTNDISVSVSGVHDPEKASDLVAQKLQKMLTDRYYHEKNQER